MGVLFLVDTVPRDRANLHPTFCWAFFLCLCVIATPVWSQVGTGVFRVDGSTGVDVGSCGSAVSPCQNIQQAVNLSSSGDEIRVAGGVYIYQVSLDTECGGLSGTSVLCILNTTLNIRGGYSVSNWTTPNPEANPTVIDGEGNRRGVVVRTSTLVMDGFTIRNGFRQGATSGTDTQTFAFGGGMLVDDSSVTLSNLTLLNNSVAGGNTGSGYGGSGAGGGMALRQVSAGSSLNNLTLINNHALGGTGPERGGLGLGGGIFIFETTLTANGLIVTGNTATGGGSGGSGQSSDSLRSDALGGGISVQVGSTVTINAMSAANNLALGGAAVTWAGRAFGGAVYVEGQTGRDSHLTINDSIMENNEALGTDAVNGGLAAGGALMAQNGSVTLDRVQVLGNRSSAGDGTSGYRGDAGGGGLYLSHFTALGGSRQLVVRNSILAGNLTEMGDSGTILGGGGGAVFLQGFNATIDHMTCAGNQVGDLLLGGCMVLLSSDLSSSATVDYSVIADHTLNATQKAVQVLAGSSVAFFQGAFSGNITDFGGAGSISGTATMSSFPSGVGFVSPGAPDFDYHILGSSPLIDLATSSGETKDVDNEIRSGLRDVGADEFSPVIFGDGFEGGNTAAWSAKIP